jgi:hypothetical protein
MCKICNDEAVSVGSLALEANTVPAYAVGVQNGSGIHTHVDLVVLHLDQALLLGLLLIHIIDEAICGGLLVGRFKMHC